MKHPRKARLHRIGPPLIGALALASAGWALAEPGTVLKATELRKEPLGSSEVIKQLKAKDTVDVSARQGAWASVATDDGLAGWVRLLNLRTGSGEQARAGFGKVAGAFLTGSSGSAASTGVKGLNASTLRSASQNWSELEKIESYLVPDEDAKAFAAAGELQPQSLDYFPDERDQKGGRS